MVFFFLPSFRPSLTIHSRSNSFFGFSAFSLYLFCKFYASFLPRFVISFLEMYSSFQLALADFDMSVMKPSHEKPAEESGIKRDGALSLLITVDRKASKVGTAWLCVLPDNATSPLQRQIHKQSIVHDKVCDRISPCTAGIVGEMKSTHIHTPCIQQKKCHIRF